jgi:hypothetical protein
MPQASFTATSKRFLAIDSQFHRQFHRDITNRFRTFGDGTQLTRARLSCARLLRTGTNTISLIATGPVGTNTMIRTAML